jgi:hypothetical protein
MSDKPFDPFRYSVEAVPSPVRRDLARMRVPELGAEELEPPDSLRERLGSLANEASNPSSAPRPAVPSEAPSTLPSASPPTRRISKAVLLALVFALASVAVAVFR